MQSKLRILWCGPFFSDVALNEKRAPNQAAAKWSRGLLRAIESNGCEIRVIDHCPEQRWPRGKVFWQNNDKKWFLDWYPCERISYLNVWGIKEHWLDWQYARAARRLFHEWRPDVVLCYNSLHSFNVAVMKAAHAQGIKCVPIILDGDDPRRDDWKKLLRDNRFADGVVFLSWWMFKNYPMQNMPLLHMDGGGDMFKGFPPLMANDYPLTTKHYTLVYTGALDYWRGLNFMKDVVRRCKRQDVRFVFCGKCDKKKMWEEFGNDPRVDVRGFVSDPEMDEICRSADIFLNVRSMPIFSTISSVSRRPAVSMKRKRTPSIFRVSSTVSRVVPCTSETMARSSPSKAFKSVLLPVLVAPAIATGTPFLIAFPSRNESMSLPT